MPHLWAWRGICPNRTQRCQGAHACHIRDPPTTSDSEQLVCGHGRTLVPPVLCTAEKRRHTISVRGHGGASLRSALNGTSRVTSLPFVLRCHEAQASHRSSTTELILCPLFAAGPTLATQASSQS
eukprot:1074821-Pelagomonas_calceolata.AAC.1